MTSTPPPLCPAVSPSAVFPPWDPCSPAEGRDNTPFRTRKMRSSTAALALAGSVGTLRKCEMGFTRASSEERYCARSAPCRDALQVLTTSRRTPHSSSTVSVGSHASGRQCSCMMPETNRDFSCEGMHTEVTALTKRATATGSSLGSSASASSKRSHLSTRTRRLLETHDAVILFASVRHAAEAVSTWDAIRMPSSGGRSVRRNDDGSEAAGSGVGGFLSEKSRAGETSKLALRRLLLVEAIARVTRRVTGIAVVRGGRRSPARSRVSRAARARLWSASSPFYYFGK